jgi:hypothetical protein
MKSAWLSDFPSLLIRTKTSETCSSSMLAASASVVKGKLSRF